MVAKLVGDSVITIGYLGYDGIETVGDGSKVGRG